MTHQIDTTVMSEAMEQIIEQGLDGLGNAVAILLNEAMKLERSRVLQAGPWLSVTTSRWFWLWLTRSTPPKVFLIYYRGRLP